MNAFRVVNTKTRESKVFEGLERQFRRFLAELLFDEVLGWRGYSVVGERYDVTLIDDEGFPAVLVETKWPDIKFDDKETLDLKRHLDELSVDYGVFANSVRFLAFHYNRVQRKLVPIVDIDISDVVFRVDEKIPTTQTQRAQILRLERLKRENFVWAEDANYFLETYKKRILVKKEKEQGIDLLIQNFKDIIKDLTPLFMDFFQTYSKREHHSGEVLRNNFNDWLKMSFKEEDFINGSEETKQEIVELFCRETAYVLLGRILFTRICEDKDILPQCISGEGIMESLLYHKRLKRRNLYLHILEDSRATIEEHYKHFYELGFFDWWLVLAEKKGLLSSMDLEVQSNLEDRLNSVLRKCLIRLNRFDFALVDKDILGDVYQGYLPSEERKNLGEFYTPREVIDYILDAVGFQPGKNIAETKIVDPSCGSGGFLVESIQRLIKQYKQMNFNFNKPEDAKEIIEGCINSVYGFDIHPFACFITEMNVLFQLVELFNVVVREDKSFKIPRINVYRTDSLILPGEDLIPELSAFIDNSRRVALIEEAKRAEEVKKEKFDFVVGNPPYVRMERIAEDERRYYMENYESGKVLRPDLYILFMERGITWLKDKGKLGYIVQNKFLALDNGTKLRELILSRCCIEQIVDVSNVKVFAESVPYPVIVILRIEKELENRLKNNLWVVIVKEDKPKLLLELKKSGYQGI